MSATPAASLQRAASFAILPPRRRVGWQTDGDSRRIAVHQFCRFIENVIGHRIATEAESLYLVGHATRSQTLEFGLNHGVHGRVHYTDDAVRAESIGHL
jgi:hypothetical protein